MTAEGTNPVRLTNQPSYDADASWSPDGSKVIFTRYTSEVPRKTSLFLLTVDGKELRRITSVAAEDHCPKWSPDGKKIAFHSDRDGNNEIYVLTVE